MEVSKLNVDVMKTQMVGCFRRAMQTGRGSYNDIEMAKQALEKGKGIYQTLETLELLSNKEKLMAITDIEYIEDNIEALNRAKIVEIFERHRPRRREVKI